MKPPPITWVALSNTILTDPQPSQRKLAARTLAQLVIDASEQEQQ